MRFRQVVLAVCAPIVASCASSGSSTNAASSPTSAASVGPVGPRWSGNLTPTVQRTGSFTGGGQARAFGTVMLMVAESDPNRTRARVTVDVPTQNRSLPWAILPGRCGAGSLPLIGQDLFPLIEVGNTGKGQIDTELPLTLPTSGTFHLNVYWQGQTLDQVMTCANLRRDGTK